MPWIKTGKRKYSIRLDGKLYNSKKVVADRTSNILKHATVGTVLCDGPEFRFLVDLFKEHPEAGRKSSGAAYLGVGVRTNPYWKQKEFCVHRADGQIFDISYKSCINGKSESMVNYGGRFADACRTAVVDQIIGFRSNLPDKVRCAITGEVVPGGRKGGHVDHVVHFQQLVTEFCREHKVDVSTVEYAKEHDSADVGVVEFKEKGLASAFADYHQQHAKLRLVTTKANLTRVKWKPKMSSDD